MSGTSEHLVGSEATLHDGRFTVSVTLTFRDQRLEPHDAIVIGGTGVVFRLYEMPEILVRVLDGRAVNGYWWVQIAAVSQMATEITVSDTTTGQANTYSSDEGPFTPVADFEAFGDSAE